MKRSLIFPVTILLAWCGLAHGERLAINDLKAPRTLVELEEIQNAVVTNLAKSRAATVCIELNDGSGSGVIVSADGLVMTAAHVATGVKKKVTVVLEDGTKLRAETLGLVSDKDAALIQIKEPGTYPFVEIDRSQTTRLGDWVYSIGHSGGFDKERGSVVRLGRLIRISEGTFQSDCMLIGGDSGGPMFDLNGRLIGIHSRVGAQLQVNMHVPMTEFIAQWDAMLRGDFIGEGPYAQKPVKGSGVLGIATESRKKGGLRVTKVAINSPAETAGIKVDDVLRKCAEIALQTHQQLQDLLKERSAGDDLTFEIERSGKPQTITLTLGER
jgi:serine protease Do